MCRLADLTAGREGGSAVQVGVVGRWRGAPLSLLGPAFFCRWRRATTIWERSRPSSVFTQRREAHAMSTGVRREKGAYKHHSSVSVVRQFFLYKLIVGGLKPAVKTPG